jgi:hypothetical protein
MMSGEVPGSSSNQSALNAALCLCWCASADRKHEQGKPSQQSSHVILLS